MPSRRIFAAGLLLAAALGGIVVAQTLDAGRELAIVEKVVKARQDYQAGLIDLINYYNRVGDLSNADRAERELDAFERMEKYEYARETAGPVLEEPPVALKYVKMADDYYTDAVIIADSRRRVRRDLAIDRFKTVLEKWPESEKAPKAAYQLGELYAGLYYRDYEKAAKYYEKCYDLNPATPEPALVKAGDMYVKLGRFEDAVTMYKLAVKGQRNSGQRDEAQRKLDELAVEGY